jgi:hypothetical protein
LLGAEDTSSHLISLSIETTDQIWAHFQVIVFGIVRLSIRQRVEIRLAVTPEGLLADKRRQIERSRQIERDLAPTRALVDSFYRRLKRGQQALWNSCSEEERIRLRHSFTFFHRDESFDPNNPATFKVNFGSVQFPLSVTCSSQESLNIDAHGASY